MPELPLAGIRVLDFTQAWAGPMATRCLALLGADVVKIEAPPRMDSWRGPVTGGLPSSYPNGDPGERPYNRHWRFNAVNTDKRSLAVDLTRPGGRDLVLELARECDVAVANFSAGVLERLGLAYADLCQVRADIVLVEMPAYGLSGPFSGFPGMGHTMECMAGMAVLMGYGDGVPQMSGTFILDPIGGLHGAAAVLTALAYRRRTGRGQHIEVAQREAAMQWAGELILDWIENGREPNPQGNAAGGAFPHGAYACAGEDQWVAIAAFDARQRMALAEIIAAPVSDAAITAWTRGRDKHAAAASLQLGGVAAAPVCNGRDVAMSAYLDQRGFFQELEHPEAGCHRYAGLAFRLRATPAAMRAAAPTFGQHNREVLEELLGFSAERIAELEASGVVASAPAPNPTGLPER